MVAGREVTLDGLSAALAEFRRRATEPSILLRADARLPWVAMSRLLDACAEPAGARIFHAVLPEAGDEEGAFAWPLFAAPPGRRSADVVLSLKGPEAGPADLCVAAREAKAEDATLHVGLSVPVGLVLEAADALCRAGIRTAGTGTPIPPKGMADRWSDLKAIVREHARGSEGVAISITFDGRPLRGGRPEPMPQVGRVRGEFAGFAFPGGK